MSETRFVANSQVTSSMVGDDMALMNLRDSTYYMLNPVGAAVWQIIGQPRSLSELCEHVETLFEVERAKCRDDILELLTELKETGLVEEKH